MLRLAALTICMVFFSDACAQPATECLRSAIYSADGDQGEQVGLFLTEEQFMSIAAWQPPDGEPPLSLGRVIGIASDFARENWEQFGRFELSSIRFFSVGCTRELRRWLYVVHLRPATPSPRVGVRQSFLGILPDGTVLVPRSRAGDA